MSNLPNQSVKPFPVLIWVGFSGTRYEFEHHAIGMTFNQIGGVYIFCRRATNGLWYAVYVGETDNFQSRLYNDLGSHHSWPDITRAGATHVCAMVVGGGNAERPGLVPGSFLAAFRAFSDSRRISHSSYDRASWREGA